MLKNINFRRKDRTRIQIWTNKGNKYETKTQMI